MANENNKQFEFFCTLKESTAQITEAALQAFNHSLESFDWDDLSSDERKMVKSWHLDLQSANKALNEV
tara:strand:- start:152 stop:355 length:204 start_codon:yes stop_codon:yes gene_type:complete